MSSPTAIVFFAATIVLTLLITFWASRRATGRAGFYVASGKITGLQNGLAIAGDFLSATTFLGITGMYFDSGVDPSSIYYLTPLVGFCLLMLWIAGPLKRAGKFTLGDVMTSRLHSPMLRLYAGVSTLVISIFYLVGQLVGAGGLVSILFGLPFAWAVVLVGALMTIYVGVGGMVAATWVQIIKALLLIATVAALGVAALAKAGGIGALYDQAAAAHPLGWALFTPGAGKLDLFSAVSLAFGLSVGILGLPHLLIRFFTVPDEKAARSSALVATLVAGGVFIVLFAIIGPATNAFVRLDPRFHDHAGALAGGSNMATIHLANALGGQTFMGITAAVAFATILAVVSGLVMSMASAASHDIYGVLRRREAQSEREELLAFRLASGGIAIVAIALALAFQHYNVAFLTTLAFGIAVSANFPVLVLVLYWRRLTVAGALSAGFFGLALSTALTVLGPAVWVKLLRHSAPIFPSDYPGLLVAPLTFLVAVAVSSRPSVSAIQGVGAGRSV